MVMLQTHSCISNIGNVLWKRGWVLDVSTDWNVWVAWTSVSIWRPCSHPRCSAALAFNPPFFSLSFSRFLAERATVGVADFLQSRTFSVGSFVPLFIIPPKSTAGFPGCCGLNPSWWSCLYCSAPQVPVPCWLRAFLLYTRCELSLINAKNDKKFRDKRKGTLYWLFQPWNGPWIYDIKACAALCCFLEVLWVSVTDGAASLEYMFFWSLS